MMIETNVTDKELKEFCTWYADFHGTKTVNSSVMTTCLCGYFHTYPKAAEMLLRRCKQLGLVGIHQGKVTPL